MKSSVYVIGTDWSAPVKIGVAQDVSSRLRTLQAGNPIEIMVLWSSDPVDDPYALEAHLHRHFAAKHVRGEWFLVRAEQEVVSAVEAFANTKRATRKSAPLSVVAAAKAVACLVDRVRRRDGVSTEDAMDTLGKQYGMSRHTMWALKYRQPKDLMMSQYVPIARALWAEAGKDIGARAHPPHPEEMMDTVEAMAFRPLEATPTDTFANQAAKAEAATQRLRRLDELVDALTTERTRTQAGE